MSGLSGRCMVADDTGQNRRDQHIAGHHNAARQDHGQHRPREEHAEQSGEHDSCRRKYAPQFAEPVDHAAGEHAHDRRKDQYNAQHEGVAVKMQIVLHIDNEIREEDLHGHGKQAERRKGQIERRVLFRNSRAEPVDKVFQIAVPSRFQLRLGDQEDGHNARQHDESAEDRKEFLPLPALRHAVEQSENDEHGDQRQDGQHGFSLAPRLIGHSVGDPRVEGRVVGC